jgi:hypothetical protein
MRTYETNMMMIIGVTLFLIGIMLIAASYSGTKTRNDNKAEILRARTIKFGIIKNIDTSHLQEGQKVFVDPNKAGAFTTVEPSAAPSKDEK